MSSSVFMKVVDGGGLDDDFEVAREVNFWDGRFPFLNIPKPLLAAPKFFFVVMKSPSPGVRGRSPSIKESKVFSKVGVGGSRFFEEGLRRDGKGRRGEGVSVGIDFVDAIDERVGRLELRGRTIVKCVQYLHVPAQFWRFMSSLIGENVDIWAR